MNNPPTDSAEPCELIVIDIGNTHVAVGTAAGRRIVNVRSLPAGRIEPLVRIVDELWRGLDAQAARPIVIASVVPEALQRLRSALPAEQADRVLVIRDDVALPMVLDIDNPQTVGTDRICAAAAAYERTGKACAVADFGTAITIDCVNDEGVFLGGTILPGLATAAASLQEHTAALPRVSVARAETAMGRNTEQAIQAGIFYGAIGALREIVERFATRLGKWPVLIATGGDAPMIAEACDFVDAVVPDLCLEGVALAYYAHTRASQACPDEP